MHEKQLQEILQDDQEMWNACWEEVLKRKELRHQRVLKRQMSKFDRLVYGRKKQELGGHSNKDDCTDQGQPIDNAKKKWVINLSSIPLTKEQENLLSHRPNFAISPKKPLLGDYILNIEKVCPSLDTNTAEETEIWGLQGFEKTTPNPNPTWRRRRWHQHIQSHPYRPHQQIEKQVNQYSQKN